MVEVQVTKVKRDRDYDAHWVYATVSDGEFTSEEFTYVPGPATTTRSIIDHLMQHFYTAKAKNAHEKVLFAMIGTTYMVKDQEINNDTQSTQ